MPITQKRHWVVVLFIVLTSFAVPVLGTANAVFANTPTTTNTSQDANPDSKEKATCAVERIGWIVCPIIQSAAVISDKAFQLLADNFLRTDPQLVQDDSGTKTAWELARNIANVLFIIAFLAIIISQVTSIGITNYGIKRMIPRLLVAAIAVNVSYYICQLAVDITNILGYEIQNALQGVANGLGPSVFGSASDISGYQQSSAIGSGLLAVIAAGALGAAAVVWLTLPLLISIVLFVLITVATIIVILLLRKALIVLLIVVSPIAFVLYLLPNTERFFDKWMKMFGQLLMVFPVVGLLLGAGQLASTIVLVSGSKGGATQAAQAKECNPENDSASKDFIQNNSASSYDLCGGGSVNLTGTDCKPGANCQVTASWTLGLVAMGIAVAPLIAVWAVLKGALSAAGSIGGKLSSMSGRFTQGQRKNMKEEVEKRRLLNDRNYMQGGLRGRMGNALSLGGTDRRLKRRAGKQYAESMFNKEYSKYISDEAVKRDEDGNVTELSRFGNKLAGGSGALETDKQRIMSDALNTQRQAQAEEFKAATIRTADMGDDQLHAIVDIDKIDVNDPTVAAAIDELGKRNDFGRLERIMNAVASKGPSLATRTLASTLNENASQMFTGGQIANISRGGHNITYKQTVASNLAGGVLTPEKMATLNPSLAAEVSDVAASAANPEVASFLAQNNQSQASIIDQLANASLAVQNDQILNKKTSRIEPQLQNYSARVHKQDSKRSA